MLKSEASLTLRDRIPRSLVQLGETRLFGSDVWRVLEGDFGREPEDDVTLTGSTGGPKAADPV